MFTSPITKKLSLKYNRRRNKNEDKNGLTSKEKIPPVINLISSDENDIDESFFVSGHFTESGKKDPDVIRSEFHHLQARNNSISETDFQCDRLTKHRHLHLESTRANSETLMTEDMSLISEDRTKFYSCSEEEEEPPFVPQTSNNGRRLEVLHEDEGSIQTPPNATPTKNTNKPPMSAQFLFSIGKRKSVVPIQMNRRPVLAMDSSEDEDDFKHLPRQRNNFSKNRRSILGRHEVFLLPSESDSSTDEENGRVKTWINKSPFDSVKVKSPLKDISNFKMKGTQTDQESLKLRLSFSDQENTESEANFSTEQTSQGQEYVKDASLQVSLEDEEEEDLTFKDTSVQASLDSSSSSIEKSIKFDVKVNKKCSGEISSDNQTQGSGRFFDFEVRGRRRVSHETSRHEEEEEANEASSRNKSLQNASLGIWQDLNSSGNNGEKKQLDESLNVSRGRQNSNTYNEPAEQFNETLDLSSDSDSNRRVANPETSETITKFKSFRTQREIISSGSDSDKLESFFQSLKKTAQKRKEEEEKRRKKLLEKPLEKFIIDTSEDDSNCSDEEKRLNRIRKTFNLDRRPKPQIGKKFLDLSASEEEGESESETDENESDENEVLEVSDDEKENENDELPELPSPKRLHKRNKTFLPKTPTIKNTPLKSQKEKCDEPSQSVQTLTFLQSLDLPYPDERCHPLAKKYITHYNQHKMDLALKLFRLFNEEVFLHSLDPETPITWKPRLTKTAGTCSQRSVFQKGSTEPLRSTSIQLSSKVLDSPDRLRDTLIHEMCHAASWIISGYRDGHGPIWKDWARRSMAKFPDLPLIGRCHSYKIRTKFTYKCENCGCSVDRHSKSLDTERFKCGKCGGRFQLFVNKLGSATSATPGRRAAGLATPKTPNAFAMFVKENYKTVRKPGTPHADAMKLLSLKFAETKIIDKM